MKLYFKFEGADDATAMKVIVDDGGVESGDIEVADVLALIPSVMDVKGRLPSALRLLKFTVPRPVGEADEEEEPTNQGVELSNLTAVKRIVSEAHEALGDAEGPVVFSVRMLGPDPDAAAVPTTPPSAPPSSHTPTPRVPNAAMSSRVAAPPVASTSRKQSAPPTTGARAGGWSSSSRGTAGISAPAPPVPKNAPNLSAIASRVSLMERSTVHGSKLGAEKKVASNEVVAPKRPSSTVRPTPASRTASPLVRKPIGAKVATTSSVAPASRNATPNRLSEARPPLAAAAPTPRRDASGADADDLPPPSHDPSDNEADATTNDDAVTQHHAPPKIPTIPAATRLNSNGNTNRSTSPNRGTTTRGGSIPKSAQPFDRQLSRSALAPTPRSRACQTPDPFRGNLSTNSSHHIDPSAPAPEYVSRLYPDPEEVKQREAEAKRRAALEKPHPTPQERKAKAVHQKEATNRMFGANHKAIPQEICDEFKPLWGQPTCARCQHSKSAHMLKKKEKERELRSRPASTPSEADLAAAAEAAASATNTSTRSSTHPTSRATPTRRPVSVTRPSPAAAGAPRTSSTTRGGPLAGGSTSTPLTRRAAGASPIPVRPAAATPSKGAVTTSGVKAMAGRGTPTRPPMSPMRRLGSSSGAAPPNSNPKTAVPKSAGAKTPSKKQPGASLGKSIPRTKPSAISTGHEGAAEPSSPSAAADGNETFYLSKEGSPVAMGSPIVDSLSPSHVSMHLTIEDEEKARRQREADELATLKMAGELEKREVTPDATNASTTCNQPQLEMTPGTAMMYAPSSPDDSLPRPVRPSAPLVFDEDEDHDSETNPFLIESGRGEAAVQEAVAAVSEEMQDSEVSPSTVSPQYAQDDVISSSSPAAAVAPTDTTIESTIESPPASQPPFDSTANDYHTTTTLVEAESPKAVRPVGVDADGSEVPSVDLRTAPPSASPPFDPFEDIDDAIVRAETPLLPKGVSMEGASDPNAATTVMSEDAFAFLDEVPTSDPSPHRSALDDKQEKEQPPTHSQIPDDEPETNAASTQRSVAEVEPAKIQRPPSRTQGPRSGSTPRCSSASGRSSARNSPTRGGGAATRSASGGPFKRQNSWKQASLHHQQLEDAGLSNGSRSPQSSTLGTLPSGGEGGVPPLSPTLTPREVFTHPTATTAAATTDFNEEVPPPLDEDEPLPEGRPTLPPHDDADTRDPLDGSASPPNRYIESPATVPSSGQSKPQFGLLSGVAAFLAETEAEGVEFVDVSQLPPRSPTRTTPASSGPPSQEVSRTSSAAKVSRTVFEEY